jgi:hypothetical protein
MNFNLKLAKKYFTNIRKAVILLLVFAFLLFPFANSADAVKGISEEIKQVKTADSPTVYYLDHERGMKKSYVSVQAYLAYGNKWSDIKIISQSELDKWPDVRLVKTYGDSRVYYIGNGKKYLIKSEQEFIDRDFDWGQIVSIHQIDLNSYESVGGIDEAGLARDKQLTVKLDESNPAGANIPVNTKDNLLAVFNFKSRDKIVEIYAIAFKLQGVFNSGILSKVYLADGDGAVLATQYSSLDQKKAAFNFGDSPLTIYPGQESQIKVFVNLADCANCQNHTLQITINELSDIKANTGVCGDFPLEASVFKFIYAGDVFGRVKAEENLTDNPEAVIGSTDEIIGKFTIYETSNKEDVLIKELSFKNKGSASRSDLANFKIKDERNQIIAQAGAIGADNMIIFKINDYKIGKNSKKVFIVTGDVAGGEGKTVNLQLDEIKAVGAEYGYVINENIVNLDETFKITRKYLGVIAKDLKAGKKVFAEQTGTIIGVFEIRNNNQEITLENIDFRLEKNIGAPDLSAPVYLVDYNTGEALNSFNGSKFAEGSVNVGMNNQKLNAKEALMIALITDMPENTGEGDYYTIVLDKINYRSENRLYYSDYVSVRGAKLTVSRSNIYVYPNEDIGEASYTKGQEKVKIASFIVEAASGDDAVIDSVTLSRGDASGVISYDNGFSNVNAYINGRKSKNTIEKPFSGSYTFDGFNYKIKSGSRAEIKIYADTERDLKVSETRLKIVNLTATGYKSNIPAVVSGLGTDSYRSVVGVAEAEISAVAGGSILPGESHNLVAGFKIKNSGNEDLTLKSLIIATSNDGFSYSLGYKNLKIYERVSNKTVGSLSKPVAGANKVSFRNYKINAGEEAVFDVYVDASEDVSAETFQVYFRELKAKGRKSKIEADVQGDPTGSVIVAVN